MNKFFTNTIFALLLLMSMSCSSDNDQVAMEKVPKTYELQSIQWKLNENSEREIIEKKLPEFYFKNETDTVMPVIFEPFADIMGTSKFNFDSISENFQYLEVQVSIPSELDILSNDYKFLAGGIKVNLQEKESDLPFTSSTSLTTNLTYGIDNQLYHLPKKEPS